MPTATRIDSRTETAVVVATGAVSGSDVCSTLEALYADSRFKPGMRELWDLRLAQADISAADIQHIVAVGRRGTERRGAGKTAIVTPHDYEVGIANVLRAQAESLPVDVLVFRDYGDAERWLFGQEA